MMRKSDRGGLNAGLWIRVLKYARKYYALLAWVCLTMIVCAACDTYFPIMTMQAIDAFITPGTTEGLEPFALRYFSVVALQSATVWGFCLMSGRVEVGVCRDMRNLAFRRIQELPVSYFDTTPTGNIIARLTTDCQRLADCIGWSLIDIMWGTGYLLTSIAVMFGINARLALCVLAVIPPLAITTGIFQKRILAAFRVVRRDNARITAAYNEGITGAKTTKILAMEREMAGEFGEAAGEMYASSVRAHAISASLLPIVVSLAAIATSLVLQAGGASVLTGEISLGTLALFVSYATQIFSPIQQIARVFSDIQSSQSAAERVIDLIETTPDIADRQDVVEKYGDAFSPERDAWEDVEGWVEFRDVSFSYKHNQPVLEHFNLSVRPGETIALVGETGSGKSTIVNLLCRFYEPDSGQILIDGVDYRERSLVWLESHLGYVLQQPCLFSGTIRDNIRYGNMAARDDEILKAARAARVDEFVRDLPRGYDTPTGENGAGLSAGQKQLLSIARAIVGNPRLFVLDEATSCVDGETEHLMKDAINAALEGRTGFIIAHRLSTIRSADRILVIDAGRLVEQGTHAELLKKRGRYYELYVNQFTREKSEKALG
ncbi:MAG: ABC transporter ATP-binding protein [Clostridia bacterium]|nr:ABC transporter ATP-binding protein [Clostridia bacterium]